MTKQITILLVDDHEIVRSGLKALLERDGKYEVIGEAEDGEQAIELYEQILPEITLMDIRMPIKNGIEACREIRNIDPKAKVLMLTSHTEEEAMFASIMAGAVGFVKKKIGLSKLEEAINQALAGVHMIDFESSQKLIKRMQTQSKQNDLTEQEEKILRLIGEGMTNKEIGRILGLTEKTVRNYISNLFSKMDFKNRSQAAVYVVKKNMFES